MAFHSAYFEGSVGEVETLIFPGAVLKLDAEFVNVWLGIMSSEVGGRLLAGKV